MLILANLIEALAVVVSLLLNVYVWILVARAVISWVNADRHNPIVRFLYQATEPLLYRVRRILPLSFGGIDFSPVVILVVIVFLEQFLVRSLYDLARSIR